MFDTIKLFDAIVIEREKDIKKKLAKQGIEDTWRSVHRPADSVLCGKFRELLELALFHSNKYISRNLDGGYEVGNNKAIKDWDIYYDVSERQWWVKEGYGSD